MADKRLIDANALDLVPDVHNGMNGVIFVNHPRCGGRTQMIVQQLLTRMISNAPTIDAVEVVRCKDCTYSRRLNEKEQVIFVSQCMVCKNPHGCGVKYKEYDIDGRIVLEHEYCFLGEKRKETKLQRVCPHCGAKMDLKEE